MKRSITLLGVAVLLVISQSVFADANSEAAECYVLGEKAWNAGDVDTAIGRWTTALSLKPSSDHTKDMLITALKKKVAFLNDQIEELKKSAAQAQDATRTITIQSVKAVTNAANARLLPPDRYPVETIDKVWDTKTYTSAQREAYWSSIRGWDVQWSGAVTDIAAGQVGVYKVSLAVGRDKATVIATVKMSDVDAVSVRKGTQLTVRGTLKDNGSKGHYELSPAVIMR